MFPSNFVQVLETSSPTATQSIIAPVVADASSATPTAANKLNIFGGKVAKTSLLSNNSNNSSNNNNNGNSNNNIMNNTQQDLTLTPTVAAATCVDDPTNTSSERRPKPIRGVGYGDIFAAAGVKPKPLPADPTSGSANEKLSSTMASALQKQIPKKPPPPAPATENNNGIAIDQAPALPPKPANQIGPLLQHYRPSIPLAQQSQPQPHQQPQVTNVSQQQQVREQARAIYEYTPINDDELAMKVGDIINILDKEIEDAGWWKGELRGNIGVFPDNFVEIIEPAQESGNKATDRHHTAAAGNVQTSVVNSANSTRSSSVSSQPTTPNYSNNSYQNAEGKIKSVFAATPKGFGKEHNSPASFLSLKRNKFSTSESITMVNNENEKREEITSLINKTSPSSNTAKLNHITANRAKGPSRRPPSNVLSKRNLLEQNNKRESNGRDESGLGSLPVNSTSQVVTNHDSLSSLPAGQHSTISQTIASFTNKHQASHDEETPVPIIKPSLSLDNVIDNQLDLTPKTSLRATQPIGLDKSKAAVTPPWMVELKKAHAEKKRDSPAIVNPPIKLEETDVTPVSSVSKQPVTDRVPFSTIPAQAVPEPSVASNISMPSVADSSAAASIFKLQATNDFTPNVTTAKQPIVDQTPSLSIAQYDNLVKQISKNVTSEISQLKEEVKRLREDVTGIGELKNVIEVMRSELRACQSATENQKRYIKELVNNLADERKRIAAMQTEIDRNLK